MKKFNLSEKIIEEGVRYPNSYLRVEDVKKFIKLLKELDNLYGRDKITWKVYLMRKNKIAGERLK